MSLLRAETMPIRSDSDVVLVRQHVRAWAVEQGFGLVDQTKMVTAASELAETRSSMAEVVRPSSKPSMMEREKD